MQLRAFLVVEVIHLFAVKWHSGHQVELGAVRQVCRLIDLDPTILNTDSRRLHGSYSSAFRATPPLCEGAVPYRGRWLRQGQPESQAPNASLLAKLQRIARLVRQLAVHADDAQLVAQAAGAGVADAAFGVGDEVLQLREGVDGAGRAG
jgi:hypothetical protein